MPPKKKSTQKPGPKRLNKVEKATLAESELRTALVLEMLIKGCSRSYIIQYCAKNYNLRTRQIDVYIAKANAEIKETYGEKYKENIIEKHLAQIDNLYVKNYTIEDFRECRNLIESKNKMLGLGMTNVRLSGDAKNPIELNGNSEERKARIAELIAKATQQEKK